mgnify:FL=1
MEQNETTALTREQKEKVFELKEKLDAMEVSEQDKLLIKIGDKEAINMQDYVDLNAPNDFDEEQ